MNPTVRSFVSIIVTGVWVNASEFFRNEVLLKSYWVDHYRSLDMMFPSAPVNGMVWVAWGFLFAGGVYSISRRYGLVQTALISWLMGFVLMWIVAWNLSVLPEGLLFYAVPLSLLESFVAAYLCRRLSLPIH